MSAGPGRGGARKKSRGKVGKLTTLYHVGDLGRPRRVRHGTSLEGGELSVSRHPREWARIAGLGGNVYKLTKRGARFVDGRDPNAVVWAVASGYVEPVRRFLVWTGYDNEAEEERCEAFDTRAEAEAFTRADGEFYEDSAACEHALGEVEEFTDYRLGPLGSEYVRAVFPDVVAGGGDYLASDLAPIFYARAHGCDGVWWDDRYAPLALSCPRGCILQERLPEWKIELVDEAEVPDAADE